MRIVNLAVLILLLSSCVGIAVRDEVMMPLAERIYKKVREHVLVGVNDGFEKGDLTEARAKLVLDADMALLGALEVGDRAAATAVDWSLLEPWATRGVQRWVADGLISEGVATSLYQRIVNMRDMLVQLGTRLTLGMPSGGTRACRIGRHYLGQYSRLSLSWTPLVKHNRPRAQLGVELLAEVPR